MAGNRRSERPGDSVQSVDFQRELSLRRDRALATGSAAFARCAPAIAPSLGPAPPASISTNLRRRKAGPPITPRSPERSQLAATEGRVRSSRRSGIGGCRTKADTPLPLRQLQAASAPIPGRIYNQNRPGAPPTRPDAVPVTIATTPPSLRPPPEEKPFEPLRHLDASLIWLASALTAVKLTAATSVSESTVPGVSGAFTRVVTTQIDHAFRRWLVATLKFSRALEDYVGSPREDLTYVASSAISYIMNREMQLKGEYRREWRVSSEPSNDYLAHIWLITLRLQR